MGFECRHCGQCCVDECTQINLSIADIIRIQKFLNCSISDLMGRIGIKPFGDPENTNQFDYELGLNIPCPFRSGEQCDIYEARPLNCRIFPYFFLANFSAEELKDVIDPSHRCIQHQITITPEEKGRYREYSEYIGNLIMEEAKLTGQFYSKNGMKQSKILPAYVFPMEDPGDFIQAKEITKSKIKMAMQIMDKKPYKDLKNQIQNFIMRVERDIIPLNEINAKEKDILNL
jgi:Fe-S-cluster containining protein